MIIHLGGDTSVLLGKIVAILNMEGAGNAAALDFLRAAKEKGQIRQVAPPPHKSCVITVDKNQTIIYLSPITPLTLMNRALTRVNTAEQQDAKQRKE